MLLQQYRTHYSTGCASWTHRVSVANVHHKADRCLLLHAHNERFFCEQMFVGMLRRSNENECRDVGLLQSSMTSGWLRFDRRRLQRCDESRFHTRVLPTGVRSTAWLCCCMFIVNEITQRDGFPLWQVTFKLLLNIELCDSWWSVDLHGVPS